MISCMRSQGLSKRVIERDRLSEASFIEHQLSAPADGEHMIFGSSRVLSGGFTLWPWRVPPLAEPPCC